MLPNDIDRDDMKVSLHQHLGPTQNTRDLHGRIRAIKTASDNGSHTDSDSDMCGTGSARNLSLAGQIGESPLEGNKNDENYQEEAFESDALRQAPESDAASISFAALVKAQVSLAKRHRSDDDNEPIDRHKTLPIVEGPHAFNYGEVRERRGGKKDVRDFLRTSKHAPAELSSKKAVSRKREVVRTQKKCHRDPRFEPFSGPMDEQRVKRNYSFLDKYRDSEVLELKFAIRKAKDSKVREELKRALLRMESRKEAQKTKERQHEVLRRHRQDEKGKIEHGKRPFYLKKADQKKIALVQRFDSMKGKQVDKAIKKRAAKERKKIPERLIVERRNSSG